MTIFNVRLTKCLELWVRRNYLRLALPFGRANAKMANQRDLDAPVSNAEIAVVYMQAISLPSLISAQFARVR
jgi:hypothetical protein